MKENIYPMLVFKSRYRGTYEGAIWIALNERVGSEVIIDAQGSDIPCSTFFSVYEHLKPIGRGDTAQEAIDDLTRKLEEEPEKMWWPKR